MTIINQVRQILMNELGLTREVIREMASKLIEDEVKKQITVMATQGQLNNIIQREVQLVFKETSADQWYQQRTIHDYVNMVARELVSEAIREQLDVRIVKKSEQPAPTYLPPDYMTPR